MTVASNLAIAAFALLLEAAIGYPAFLFRRIGHPVIWMGRLISYLEMRLNAPSLSAPQRRRNGFKALGLLLAAALLPAILLQSLFIHLMPPLTAILVLAILAGTLLAQRSLYDHVRQVADALDMKGLEAARAAVSEIVGRDVATLDASGVARAAIESLAENFSDGVVAPALFCGVFGLPGIVAYKAVNTADSMIGHKSERYADFGFASAKLDDGLNLVPSRLSAVWLILAALLHDGMSAKTAWAVMWSDARRHRSPSAGWPEAATAGALGIRLSGPRQYHGKIAEEPWIGSGRRDLTAADIRRALALYKSACELQFACFSLLALLIAR